MIELGIVLLIVGVALLLIPLGLDHKHQVGWLLVAIGVILILVGVVTGSAGAVGDASILRL